MKALDEWLDGQDGWKYWMDENVFTQWYYYMHLPSDWDGFSLEDCMCRESHLLLFYLTLYDPFYDLTILHSC